MTVGKLSLTLCGVVLAIGLLACSGEVSQEQVDAMQAEIEDLQRQISNNASNLQNSQTPTDPTPFLVTKKENIYAIGGGPTIYYYTPTGATARIVVASAEGECYRNTTIGEPLPSACR